MPFPMARNGCLPNVLLDADASARWGKFHGRQDLPSEVGRALSAIRPPFIEEKCVKYETAYAAAHSYIDD